MAYPARGARGYVGETIAAWVLRLRGWRVRGRNVRVRSGEVDIVAWRPGHWRLVEVRTTTTRYLANATEALDHRKLRQIFRVASELATRLDPKGQCMISVDLIAVRLRWGFWPHVRWVRDLDSDR